MNSQKNKQNYTSIKIPKATARTLKIYCVFHDKKISEFAGKLIDEEIKDFKKQIRSLRFGDVK